MPGYISEYSYFGNATTEFIEVAVPSGTDVSGYSIVLYQSDGTVVESYSLGNVQSTTAGQDVYLIDSNTPGFSETNDPGEIWADDAIALVDDTGTVLQFLSHEGFTVTAVEGPANGLTSTNAGTTPTRGDSLETRDQGASYQQQSATSPGTIACFGPGTLIDTPLGPQRVETLTEGALVSTDEGPSPVIWSWRGEEPLMARRTDQRPVLIRAGALANGLPARNLVVSGQHRMLLGGRGSLRPVSDRELLVPAKALTRLRGIRHMQGKSRITWHHFALRRHALVRAEGCWTESLLLGPVVLEGLGPCARRALGRYFPGGARGGALNGPAARPCLSVAAARALLDAALLEH